MKELTIEQHDVIKWLCSTRHNMHCHQESFFYGGNNFMQLIYGDKDSINDRLTDCGLPPIKFSIEMDEFYSETDEKTGILDKVGLTRIESLLITLSAAEQINTDIESYLRDIDYQYNTQYCPTGIKRRNYERQN